MNTTDITHNSIRILVIDDDEEDFLLIKHYCDSIQSDTHFIFQWCPDYQQGIEALCSGIYSVGFVDFKLGLKTGLELINEVMPINRQIPLILLTGAGNREIAFHAMQAGAADYLVKSELSPEKLERCVRYALSRRDYLHALGINEQKYRGIFENTMDFIFIADGSALFREVNQSGETLLGYSSDELYTMGLTDLLLYPSTAATLLESLRESKVLTGIEVELRAKNHRVLNCMLSLSMGKDAQEEPYIQGIIHDITALKIAEKAALQTAKLRATEKLVRILAHEVRNPLNNIVLALENLHTIQSGSEKVYLDIVTRNSNRINTLITELLYASKPHVVHFEKITLQTVLNNSIAAARDRLMLKNVTLHQTYCADDDAWIEADAGKLSIAFVNIIINGIEACPASGACLQINLTGYKDSCEVSISDNGQGIDEANMSELFQPYFSSKGTGMGLGLASALSIFESHNALVQVKSAPEKGTTFRLLFKKTDPVLKPGPAIQAALNH